MNYSQLYDSIIGNRIRNQIGNDAYFERHHIIPKSLGGSDQKNNIVRLTPKEHYICHLLLLKMHPPGSNQYYKMLRAFMCMVWLKSKNQTRYVTSRVYEKRRLEHSNRQSKNVTGDKNPNFGKRWITNPVTNDNTRIQIDEEIPEGWVPGRFIKEKKLKPTPKSRDTIFTDDKKRVFIDEFLKTGSMNAALKNAGFPYGALGIYYKWGSKVLKEMGLRPQRPFGKAPSEGLSSASSKR